MKTVLIFATLAYVFGIGFAAGVYVATGVTNACVTVKEVRHE